ncbi:hypothetical protein RPIT_02600 [Tessaracoccus flavus]|uniref:Uncharacterized protein n=2 Tax=Tessaracoccus flavus TaxID=1610493 RepID=A0A1Q2CIL4_9ACTN|nr:hypothetical protein RPIT_02600 [Tessaracoccus flavus]SDY25882.1 Pimeloyl-ACP methyl ester carboxylesterase [Tessaracoccus flavus]
MSSAQQWADYPALLPEFDVVAIDLPGHGSKSGTPFTTEAALDAIAEAVDGAVPVVLAGHSLGAYLVGLFAGTRPHRLRGLVLMGATGNPRGRLAWTYRGFAGLTRRVDHSVLARLRGGVARLLGVRPELLPARPDYTTLPAIWESVMRDCPPSVLRSVGCPVLFINGQFDQMRADERRYLARVEGSALEIVPRASHFAPLTHAPEVAEAIRRFGL